MTDRYISFSTIAKVSKMYYEEELFDEGEDF